ncbi:MAG: HAMP domain-containing sensor histidine kinase, partial [Firmicutes bacterium]|nr:HAMP domain-containing sensor histidine kinase [Bacillota bacterium]
MTPRRWRGTLTARLVLSHVLVATIGLLVAAAFAGVVFEHFLISSRSAALADRGRQIARVVSGYFDGRLFPSETAYLLRVLEGTLEAQVYVVDTTGQVILESRSTAVPHAAFPLPVLQRVLLRGRTWRGQLRHGGVTVVAAGVPVFSRGQIAGGVFLEASLSPARATARSLVRLLLLGEALAVVVGVLLAYTVSRRMVAPIERLKEGALRLGEDPGGAGVRVTPEGPEEIRELGQEFNRMADRLDRQMQQLKEEALIREELLANVAHDLKTPLTSIRGFLEAVRDHVAEGPAAERAVQVAWEETLRLQRLVQRLLTAARIRSGGGEPRGLDVTWVVAQVLERMGPLARERGVRLVQEGRRQPTPLCGDADALMEAVMNLVDNALAVSPVGQAVRVAVEQAADSVRVA